MRGFVVDVPGLGPHTRFERPPLLATLRMKHGQLVHVMSVHLKSKRPKFLQDANGNAVEDREPHGIAVAGRSRVISSERSDARCDASSRSSTRAWRPAGTWVASTSGALTSHAPIAVFHAQRCQQRRSLESRVRPEPRYVHDGSPARTR